MSSHFFLLTLLGLWSKLLSVDLVRTPSYLTWHAPCDPLRDQKGFQEHTSCGKERYLVCKEVDASATCECIHSMMTWDPDARKTAVNVLASPLFKQMKIKWGKPSKFAKVDKDDGEAKGSCKFRIDGPCTRDEDCFTNLKCMDTAGGEKTCQNLPTTAST